MRTEWTALLIAAGTDFAITFATALAAVMMGSGSAELPSKAAVIVAFLGGIGSAAQTIREARKATPDSVRRLRGE